MINIDDLTLGQIKEIIGMTKCTTDSTGTFLVIGKNYLIRTVTHYHVGRLIRIKKYASLLAGLILRNTYLICRRSDNECNHFENGVY